MAELALLAVSVAELEFAFDLGAVKEVIRPPDLVCVADLPAFVSGVINFRGVAIPVIDLGVRFQAKAAGDRTEKPDEASRRATARLVICAVGSRVVAFAVDGASEIVRVPAEAVLPPADGVVRAVVKGVVPVRDRLLCWLDPEGLLSGEERVTLDSFRMRKEDLGPKAP